MAKTSWGASFLKIEIFGKKNIELGHNLLVSLLYITLYLCLTWLIHMVVVSVAMFFHFLLDHNLRVVDSWFWDQAWIILIFTKVLTIIPFVFFLTLSHKERYPIASFFKSRTSPVRKELFVIMVFIFLLLLITSSLSEQLGRLEIYRAFIVFLGVLSLYLIDVFFFLMLQLRYGLRQGERVVQIIFLSGGMGVIIANMIHYVDNINITFLAWSVITLFLSVWRKDNFISPFVYISLVIFPLFILFGRDIIWAESFSYYYLESKNYEITVFSAVILSLLYLSYTSFKNRPIS